MKKIAGTRGYAETIPKFIEGTMAIDFQTLHRDFLPFIPRVPSHILDVGAGIGRDAFEFWKMGHTVVAVEPLLEFRTTGKDLYQSSTIEWWDDALPTLEKLDNYLDTFDFTLASGVWHHLNLKEQTIAMQRISELLNPGGLFALSLRNGPAGAGKHIFPTELRQVEISAKRNGLIPIFNSKNQPSLMPNKPQVIWDKLVLKKME